MATKKKRSATMPTQTGNRPRLQLDRSTSLGELGARIREARDARGYDLYEAARRSEISHSALQKIETAANDVKLSTLLRIAAALGADLGELCKGLPLRPKRRG